MPDYLVTWQINIEADDPEDAAIEAQRIQRNPESTATCFDVQEVRQFGGVVRYGDPVQVDLEVDL